MNIMEPQIWIRSDEAEMVSGKYRFYYGRRLLIPIDDEHLEWGFCVWVNGVEKTRISNSKLDSLGSLQGPSAYLLAGIALYLGKK